MIRYTRVRLAPKGPFHFGGRGVGMEHSDVGLPADSLFSALCVTLAAAGQPDQPEKLLAQFNTGRPPFRLTSLMPFAGEIYFLPYPLIGPPHVEGATDLKRRKRYKKIAWVSTPVFADLARGRPPTALEGDEPVSIHGGKIWLTSAEKEALQIFTARDPETHATQSPVLWRTGRRPRVTVDRRTSGSAVYSTGATEFNHVVQKDDNGKKKRLAAGLYTVIEWLDADEALRKLIERTFEQMGATGIGGERSSGHGQFDVHCDDLDTWVVGDTTGGYFTTLSPYHPRLEEQAVIGDGARYEIVLRRGWLSLARFQNLRRASVRMIGDGSVLRWPTGVEPIGDLVDLTPEKMTGQGVTIYRYGLAFPVRIADAALAGPGGGP